ncbi:MAG: SUMF1/EgtB/PvdO family nonheme iron enzyme [Lentisphaerae bacterium]|nr:SUMF1/EgtB/PvdO family nonheme iron enzyme [Lentisphaerota bacterium]
MFKTFATNRLFTAISSIIITLASFTTINANAQTLVYSNPAFVDSINTNDITDSMVAGDSASRVAWTVENPSSSITAQPVSAVLKLNTEIIATFDGSIPKQTNQTFYVTLPSNIIFTAGEHLLTLEPSGLTAINRPFTVAAVMNINFDPVGGTPTPADITVTNGFAYGELPQPLKDDHNFMGWYTNVTYNGDEVVSNTVVTATTDHTLYAKWFSTIPIIISATFDPQGGTPPTPTDTFTVTNGLTYGDLPLSYRPGHTLKGWYTLASGGDIITSTSTVTPTSDHTIYAQWELNPVFEVTFDPAGGSATPSVTVTNGIPYGTLPTPTRPGYDFSGWYPDSNYTGQIVTAATVVTATTNHTLYANWEVQNYTVTLNPTGGTITPDTLTVAFASPYGTLPAPDRVGYTFDNWYASADYSGDPIANTTPVTATTDHTLYAKWIGNIYKVTFNANSGSVSPISANFTFGAPYSPLPTPTRPGYTFDGWYLDATGFGDIVTTATPVSTANNHTLYAKWQANPTMTVSFDPQGGTTPSPTSRTLTNGLTYQLATVQRAGFQFKGWFTEPNGNGQLVTTATVITATTNHTLYAKWEVNAIFTVTFDSQGGSTPTPATITVTNGLTYGTLPQTAYPGFILEGWYTAANGIGTKITAGKTVATTESHTLYAYWTPAAIMEVNFNSQGGSTPTPATITVTNSLAYGTLPQTSYAGFDFLGWYTSTSQSGTLVSSDTTVTATTTHTLYARWVAQTYIVTLDPQGGTVAPPTIEVTYNSRYGALPVPTRHGYPDFEGWFTEPNGNGTEVTAASVVSLTASHTLYAKWYNEQFANFIVVDLAAGADATTYPVTYLATEPNGGWVANTTWRTTKLVLKRIRAGEFYMGTPDDELFRESDETRHKVTLSEDYFIGLFPVTQQQYELVMGHNPSDATEVIGAPQFPVESVTYHNVRGGDWPTTATVSSDSFIGKLRAKTGLGSFDLPTEAQWEDSCRAEVYTALNSGKNLTSADADNNLGDIACYLFSGGKTNTTPSKVGYYPSNQWGLYDFHGNVWEWCRDWYAPYSGTAVDPAGGENGQNRIIRGGSWGSLAHLCRAGNRNSATPETTSTMIGFRLMASLPGIRLDVNNGEGSGWYSAGSVQTINATTPPTNTRFTGWQIDPPATDLGPLFVASAPQTSITIPTANVTVSAIFTPLLSITVTFDPQGGTVTPATTTVTSGSSYGTLPTPQRDNHIFRNWWLSPDFSGAPVVASTVVTTTTPHTLYAQWSESGGNGRGDFICNPFTDDTPLASKGSYDGFLYSTETVAGRSVTSLSGTLTLKVTALTGKLSGKILLQNGNISFSAKAWDETTPDGLNHVTITSRNGETIELNILQNRLWGTVSGGRIGTGIISIDGTRNRFAERSDSAAATILTAFRGSYALALTVNSATPADPAVDATPEGAGYLSVTIGTRGSAKIAGILADGTKVSRSSRLILYENCSDASAVPLFAPLYAKRGLLSGLAWFYPQSAAVTDIDNDWSIRWEKPGRGADGFSAILDLHGGFHNSTTILNHTAGYLLSAETSAALFYHAEGVALPQTALADLLVTANGSRLTVPRGKKPLRIKDADTITYQFDPDNETMAKLSFTTRSGIFRGNFTLYYTYEQRGKNTLKSLKTSYAGIVVPDYLTTDGTPYGLGHALTSESNPDLRQFRLKRSWLVTLDPQ